MSLQLPTILPPPTPCIPFPTLTVSPWVDVTLLPFSLPGQLSVFWASPFPSRLTNASGRIEFIIFLIMDWLFASGCSPPRLSATQLPSATDSQCSVRRGLPPRCWCALSGALGSRSGVTGVVWPDPLVLLLVQARSCASDCGAQRHSWPIHLIRTLQRRSRGSATLPLNFSGIAPYLESFGRSIGRRHILK